MTRITRMLTQMNGAKRPSFAGVVFLALLALFFPACTSRSDPSQTAANGSAQVTLDAERFMPAQDAAMEHFVAAIDDDLFIGVAVAQQGAGDEEPRTVAVYLCDGGQVSQWMRGEISGQQGILAAATASAEVTLAADSVSGVVTLDGARPQSFTAEPAADGAGIYRAEWRQGGVDYYMDWVILNDGRQRGPLDGKGNDPLILHP